MSSIRFDLSNTRASTTLICLNCKNVIQDSKEYSWARLRLCESCFKEEQRYLVERDWKHVCVICHSWQHFEYLRNRVCQSCRHTIKYGRGFRCDKCDEAFADSESFYIHMNVRHIWRCNYCKFETSDFSVWERHRSHALGSHRQFSKLEQLFGETAGD